MQSYQQRRQTDLKPFFVQSLFPFTIALKPFLLSPVLTEKTGDTGHSLESSGDKAPKRRGKLRQQVNLCLAIPELRRTPILLGLSECSTPKLPVQS